MATFGKLQLASKLDALISMGSETSPERRRELMREATDVFFAPTRPPAEVLALFDAALDRMTDQLEVELRADLARRLAPMTDAPRRLLSRLMGDPEGWVAEPILEGSRQLTETDLLGVVRAGGQTHLRAVSRRDDLTETVSDVIVDRGDDETLGVLVGNAAAPLSRAASEKVVDRAKANPALHAAVVNRESLPPDLLNEMYHVVEHRLRERIQARNALLDPATLDALIASAGTRMAVRDGALPADHAEASAYVSRLSAGGPISGQTLMGFARAGERTRFMAALAQEAQVDFGVVRRAMDRRDADAFTLLCKAAGYSEDLFRDLVLQLRPGGEVPSKLLIDRFAALPRETAQRTVRFWKVRREAVAQAA